MTEILWDGFKNQKLLAERAYKDEHGDNIAETYAKKADLDTKVDTSSFNSAIDDINSDIEDIHDWAQDTFVSGDELTGYYKKSETSGASELAAEFEKYQPVGDYVTTDELDDTLKDYVQEDELAGYYTTANPSGFLNAASAEAAGFATETWVEEQDYALSSDVAAALGEKLDITAAEETYYPKTNPAGYISEIPSEYITETELSTELSNYTDTAELESMLEGKQDVSGMTGYYPSTNPSGFLNVDSAKTAGFATETWVEEKNYALSSDVSDELSKKLDSDTAEATYYPLNENPAGYLTNTDLESYATKSELGALDTKVDVVSGNLDNLNDTVTGLSETVEGIDDTVEQVVSDIENIEGELDTHGENIAFISGAVDFVSANIPSVAGYALSADVDTRLADKQDVTAMSAYAQKTWVDSEYVSETELETALAGYYTKDETSGATELATEFGKYQPAGDYVTTASLESTLSDYATTGWAESTFLTAVPPGYALSADVDTRLADKLDEDTADSKYYPLNENPSGYLTAHQSLEGYALSADVDTRLAGKVDKVEGKGLSTNDFTTVDKNRLDEAWGAAHTHSNKSILDNITAPYTTEEKTKLAGIESGAQVNVQADWEQSDSAASDFIKNKPEGLSIAAGEGIDITEANNTLTISVSADYATVNDINFLSGTIDGKVATTAFNDTIEEINDTFEEIGADIDFLSGAIDDIPSQVQSDWTEADTLSPAYIQNKPTSLSMSAGTGIDITETSDTLTFSVTGDYVTTDYLTANYYDITETSASDELDVAFNAKQDVLVFEYDENDAISAINSSAIAGQKLEAGTDLVIDNGIVKVNTNGTVADSAEMSFAAGSGTYASGIAATVFGTNCIASGVGAFAAGRSSSALGNYAFAMGYQSYAIGAYVHAEGGSTSAFGNQTHAEGNHTVAEGSSCHSEGQRTSGIGIACHVEGDLTVASANCSHAEGNATYTLGNRSHSEGSGTSAYGICSHSEGKHTIASGDYQHVQGQFNNPNTTDLLQVGNGTADNARSNAFIVQPNGLASATNLGTSCYPDIDNTLSTMEQAIAGAGSFKVVSLTTAAPIVPDVNDPSTKVIYLTKATTATVTDPYKEWIWLSGTGGATSSWECIGDMSVDLSNYYTKNQADNKFCTTTTAQKLSDYAGGNGIVVAGDVYTTKSIASNLTEVPLQDGTGIHVSVITGGVSDYAEIAAKPEILLYQTTSPVTNNQDGTLAFSQAAGTFTEYNTKNGDLGVTNTSITGLDTDKLYNYNIKAAVSTTVAETVSLKGPNWNSSYSNTSAYVNGNGTMELDCYIKGATEITVSAYRTGDAAIGIIEVSVTEVCDV